MKRTLIKELKKHFGKEVLVKGWVSRIREIGGIGFVLLRERSGVVQLVVPKELYKELSAETPIEIKGMVCAEQRAPEGLEVHVKQLKIYSKVQPLPIQLEKELPLPTLMKHRPISLRAKKQQAIFKVHAELVHAFREFMRSKEFTEIHSTKLTSSGLEGGSEIFELQYFEKKGYLAQSPQFYKQMMVGVFERVFEVGKVYRAEPHATTRHLAEYVGLDFEMGFIESVEEVMEMEEALLKYVFKQLEEHCKSELKLFGAEVPRIKSIPRIPFLKAVELLEQGYKKEFGKEDLTPEMERLLCEFVKQKYGEEFVFVTEYPWKKRPFYAMPKGELSESFDLLFRGLEITTGGQRVHEYEQLLECMKQKKVKPEAFESYLMCFKYGMPPHGGLGIGSERIVKQLLGLPSVEEASLIPRTKERFLH
ncbi:aspartate--tRNA(Asn) ligase [Candidatus Woesearchaeota archaeon CG10_big_fil_rev_8_21_14_0_10_37_12]|nr:MAG: aspartate--tRNA(Asn) ligase [Candidatus Woesearchaeota archaeon CG10_big_fil_rev_8_21_14_0_10_37_12]